MDRLHLVIRRALEGLDLQPLAPAIASRELREIRIIDGEHGAQITPEREYPRVISESFYKGT